MLPAPPPPPPPALCPEAPPPSDLTSISARIQWFLDALGGCLHFDHQAFEYFAQTEFYDRNCNNEKLRMRGINPLDAAELKKMVGWEYSIHTMQPPLLFVLKKQERKTPDKVIDPVAFYYILDGTVYQAPTLMSVFSSRTSRAIHHLQKAFSGFRTLLKDRSSWQGGDKEQEGKEGGSNGGETAGRAADQQRMDQIIMSTLQWLPPIPTLHVPTDQPPSAVPPASSEPAGDSSGTAKPRKPGEASEKKEVARATSVGRAPKHTSGALDNSPRNPKRQKR